MTKTRLLTLFTAGLACAGLGCQKNMKTSSMIVQQTLTPIFGVSASGTLKWISASKTGPSFRIVFKTPVKCMDGNHLTGSPKAAAYCKLSADSDGLYKYVIEAVAPNVPGPTEGSAGGPTLATTAPSPVLLAHVDGCDGCSTAVPVSGVGGPSLARATTSGPGPLILIDCDSKNTVFTSTDPSAMKSSSTQVAVGQTVEWSQVGPKTNLWKVVLPAGVCGSQAVTLGNDGSASTSCVVTGGGDPSYNYPVTLSSCANPGQGTLQISAQTAPH